VVFRAGDNGDVAPIRIIKGSNTGIKNPTGLTLDSQKGEVYVTNMGTPSMSVFPMMANGDVRPLRTIRAGPANWPGLMIGNPGAVGYDTKREQILVPN
jgi:DNA-binding beta-propeller fold protein YncE